MASSKNETKKEAGNPADKQEPVMGNTTAEKNSKSGDSVYTVDEFCNNAQKLFHTMPECVRAALMEKGITQCSTAKAEKIVKEFLRKEVK